MFRSQEAELRPQFVWFVVQVRRAMLLAVLLWAASRVDAAGFVHSPNFVIFTPPIPTQQDAEQFAKAVLDRAEQYRKQIALEWLGEELPPSVGHVVVNVNFSAGRDSALTWAKDHPD